MTEAKNKPIDTIRDGSLSAVIWANASEKGMRYSVELVRGYKDSNDQWKNTSYFSNGEILRGSRLLNLAYNRISELRKESKSTDNH